MSQGAGYFILGWFTCAIMSGSLLMLAARAYVVEDQADEHDGRAGDSVEL